MSYIVYGKPNCPFCDKAKNLLESKGKEYVYVDVSENQDAYNYLVSNGFRSVPQVFLKGKSDDSTLVHVGGYEGLLKALT